MDSFRPLVRFSGFGGEWEKVKLGDCLEISTEKNEDNTYGINEVLSVSDEEGVVNQIQLLGRSYAGKSVSSYKVLKTNQIVYTKSPLKAKPFGIIKVNKGDIGIVSVLYAVFDAKKGVFPDFIHYYFEPPFRINNYLHPLIKRGAKNTMNISDIDSLQGEIAIPCSIEEQQSISNYFTKLDEELTLQTQKLSKLKQIKAASLQNMFPQEGQMLPKVRFAGFEGEWERVRLGEIAQFFKGKGYSKNDLTEKGSPIFLYGMMYTKYRFAVNEVDTYTDKDFSSLLSQGNEVIIPASGETAEDIACASAFLIKDVILGGDLNVICFDLSLYSTPFIALSISNGSSRKYLSKCAQGKSVVHLRNSDIKTVVLSLPSLPEQQAIANYFTKLDRKIELETQKLAKLKQIKSACLSKMFV